MARTLREGFCTLEVRDDLISDVRAVRHQVGATQFLFAAFLGINIKRLRHWENTVSAIPEIVQRFLAEVYAFPQIYEEWLTRAVVVHRHD